MYRQLLITEFMCNRTFLGLSLMVNLFYALLGFRQIDTMEFLAVTLVSFYILLIIATSFAGHEKRNRQFMQLPTNASQVFLAGWSFVLLWLVLQVCLWFAFALIAEGSVDGETFTQIASAGIGTAIMITMVSIGIDLSAFRPRFIQWLYIGLILLLLAMATHNDISIGLDSSESGVRVLPLSLFAEGNQAVGLGVLIFAVAMLMDYLVFRNSDNYLS